jgi:hypothetical protein
LSAFLTRTFFALCASAILVAPAAGLAQVEATPIPAVPKPDFSSMQYLIGTWNCSIKSSRRPAPYTVTSTYAMSPDGWWINETSIQHAMKWFPQQTTIDDKITYDSTTHRWVDVTYGGLGAYGLSFAKGYNGNQILWHDVSFAPNADIKAQSDTTITKLSNSKVSFTSNFTEASGRVVNVVGACTKSS